MRSRLLRLFAIAVAAIAYASGAETFSAYYIGNSLSNDMYNAFRKVATDYQAAKGDTYS